MSRDNIIEGYMTARQAADATGLSAHRVGCLARDGELDSIKVGNTLFVDAAAVLAYAQSSQGRGRPMEPKTAWAALWLLLDRDADWLDYPQMRRLKIRMGSSAPESLLWQMRRRATRQRFRISPSFLDTLKSWLHLTGISSRELGVFGLVPLDNVVEGYCLQEGLGDITRSCHMVQDPQGNAIIHVAQWLPPDLEGQMPVSVVAADLCWSLNSRERAAGMVKFKGLIDAYRAL